MSIGFIMFGKALILSIWGGIVESWFAYRKRRAVEGLPLRKNAQGVYVPRDWAADVEAFVRGLGRFIVVVGIVNLVVLMTLLAYRKLT